MYKDEQSKTDGNLLPVFFTGYESDYLLEHWMAIYNVESSNDIGEIHKPTLKDYVPMLFLHGVIMLSITTLLLVFV